MNSFYRSAAVLAIGFGAVLPAAPVAFAGTGCMKTASIASPAKADQEQATTPGQADKADQEQAVTPGQAEKADQEQAVTPGQAEKADQQQASAAAPCE